MNKIAILILIAFNWIPLSAKIPLQQAITRGIQKSLVIQNNLLEQKNLKLEKKNRDMKKWLALHLGGSYIFKSQQMEINFSEIQITEGISIPLEPIIVGARHNYDLKLALTQPIYTGNRLSNSAKLKDIQYEMEKHNAELNTIEISTRIKISYFTYRMLFYQRQSVNAFLETLRLHQRKMEDFYIEDLIKKSDLLETESRLQEQRMNLEEIKHQIAREKINFKSLCDFNIEDISGDYTETIEPGSTLLSNFQNYHPYFQILNDQIRLLEIQKRLTNAEYLPQLVGFAEIHYGRPGIDYFTNEWSLYFQGGIGFNLKLFDWNQRKRNQKILNYSQEKYRNKQKDFSREVENQVRQLLESKKAAEIKLAIIGNLIEMSREDTELKAELFQEQQITNKDYLASLATKERYIFMEKEQQLQIEMIKVSINRWLGLLDQKL